MKVASPRTMNNPTNASGSHMTVLESRSNSARSVSTPVSFARIGSVAAATEVASKAKANTLR